MTDVTRIMLFSDMDGTLLGDNMSVSEKNKKAIDRFIEAGGTFGIATGRSQVNVKPFIEGVSINGPSILYNGAMLYDFYQEKVVDVVTLEKEGLKDVMKWILQTYPEVMIFVYTKEESHLLSGKDLADESILKDHEPYVVSELSRIEQESWVKILLAGIWEDLEAIRRHLEEKDPAHYRWVSSSDIFLEILPAHVSKSTMFPKLKKTFGEEMRIVVLGDYYNDEEMLKEADYSVAMGNAPEELKALAKDVTGFNYEDGVAQFIERLLEGTVEI
ncbi:HAD family hydrolase [Proteiniclasticum sp.]|uniref:HAD family hydrolase n=1 Tax=Proteiniclasticum sp. TaxID=2053595 RepID=UPI0028A23768|nr:HAD family hydrolase [Proteiniclasticum sp.]